MRDLFRRVTIISLTLATVTTTGCQPAPEGWTPVLEETSTRVLSAETEAVAARVRTAIAEFDANPDRASQELAAADERLDHLLTYYLPLAQARGQAHNAYVHYALGSQQETGRELDEIEGILIEIANSRQGHLVRAMEEPLETLEDARVALGADSDEATRALEALAQRLNLLLIKGGLVLAGTD